MTSRLPSLIAMYAKAVMPSRTKTPTMSSSFVSCMGTGPPGLPGGDNFGPGPDSNELPHGGMPGPLELFRRRHLDDHPVQQHREDRKSTRLNSSHGYISYAVFCLKKKKPKTSSSKR